MAFLLIMVATGWVWSRAEERVSRWHSQESAFFGERESSKRTEHSSARGEVKRELRERFQGGVLVFILGLLGTSQWLS